MKKTVTLNMAAALVKFLQRQYVRRDGVEHRLIHGVFGIFGHGNVTGFGQALEEHGGRALPYFQPKIATPYLRRLPQSAKNFPSLSI